MQIEDCGLKNKMQTQTLKTKGVYSRSLPGKLCMYLFLYTTPATWNWKLNINVTVVCRLQKNESHETSLKFCIIRY